MKIDDVIKDLKEHNFYTVGKAYIHLQQKYNVRPENRDDFIIHNAKIQSCIDIYPFEDGKLWVIGETTEDHDLKCKYLIEYI